MQDKSFEAYFLQNSQLVCDGFEALNCLICYILQLNLIKCLFEWEKLLFL